MEDKNLENASRYTVDGCNSCPFRVQNYDDYAVNNNTSEVCNLAIDMNKADYFIDSYNKGEEEKELKTPEWCPLIENPFLIKLKKETMKKSKYLYRPSDYSIFVNIGKDKYVHEMNIENDWIGNEYSYKVLTDCGFKPCSEKNFDELRKKHKLYLDWESWSGRPDGHGGIKGGTMEEYLETL